jgi:hypothetical protein
MAEKGFNQQQLDQINGKLDSLVRWSQEDVPLLIKNTTTDIKADVTSLAPVRTGNLRRSIYQEIKKFSGKVFVDTVPTDTRKSGFNYGRTVEHGRAGRYKTTPYWYNPVKKRLGVLLKQLNAALKHAAIKGK